MIITGIAPSPQALSQQSYLPSGELMYLAHHALEHYQASELVTSLTPGWELALAKAAVELEIPYTVAVPYPQPELEMDGAFRQEYLELRAGAKDVYRLSECYQPGDMLNAHFWRVENAALVLALWDYEFQGNVYQVIRHALSLQKDVSNLWEPWSQLVEMRRVDKRRLKPADLIAQQPKTGARVFKREA